MKVPPCLPEEGWTSGREGEQSKAQTRTPRRDSNSPRRIRHRMSGGIKAGMASQRGKKKEKAPASAKNFVKNKTKQKKASASRGNSVSLVRLPLQRLILCFVLFFLFPTAGNICENDGKQSGKLFSTVPPSRLHPTIPGSRA